MRKDRIPVRLEGAAGFFEKGQARRARLQIYISICISMYMHIM